MGGFVGFIGGHENIIKNMADKIKHRGTDESFHIGDNIALGVRGGGFAYSLDKNLVICCDSNIDAGIILREYEEHGEKVAEKLQGAFAFIIYNINTGELYGARDCFGVKPFYYLTPSVSTHASERSNNIFMFGSEIKSFLAHPDFKKELNAAALKIYMIFQYSALEETFFKGVFRLNNGCYFIYKNNEIKVTQYFEPEYKTEEKSFDEYLEIISNNLISSVELNKCDEIGSFLSGGVDSSYIAALAKPDKSFTVGFGLDGFDESVYARELSAILDIKNYSKIISGDEFFDALPQVQYYSDEPHANLSSVPLYYLSQMAAEHTKIVLSGEGADEFFAGYRTYAESRFAKNYNRLPFGLRRIIKNIVRKLPAFKGRDTIIKCGRRIEDYYIGQAFIMDNDEADYIISDKYKSEVGYKDVTAPYFAQVKGRSDLVKKLYLDLFLWLPNDIFLKADRMTAAHSLEARIPILNKEMFELASKIPAEYLIKDGVTKYIFREAANKVMPNEWANRPKVGFTVPFKLWIKEQKYYNILKNMFEADFAGEFFKRDRLFAMLDAHFSGEQNNGRKLYTVYAFLIWYKIYFIDT